MMFDQTAVMIWTYGNEYRVEIGPRFDTKDRTRSYTPTAASMARLMALPLLTADWPVSINFTMGSIFLHYTIENEPRRAWKQIHAGRRNDEPSPWDGYRGPSALTQAEREELGNELSEALS